MLVTFVPKYFILFIVYVKCYYFLILYWYNAQALIALNTRGQGSSDLSHISLGTFIMVTQVLLISLTLLRAHRINATLSILLFDVFVNAIIFLNSFLNSLLLVCRNMTDFCSLILYPETFLNSVISFQHVNNLRDKLTSFFLIWMSIISISCWIALTRTSSVDKEVVKVDRHTCFVVDFVGKTLFLNNENCGLFVFIVLKSVSPTHNLNVFITKGY